MPIEAKGENVVSNYKHPEVLVSTEWVATHRGDADVRVIEVDVNTKAYDDGHVPGAIAWDWNTQLCDTVRRDILSKSQMEQLLSSSGVNPDTTLVVYGDNNNWFAAWAVWQAKLYGHRDVRLMDGGRKKWLSEGRELSKNTPQPPHTQYHAIDVDLSLRAFLPQVREASVSGLAALVDVRSLEEFTGEILAPPGIPETCQRGGHVPGARNVPWGKACNSDGTFKSADELRAVYGSESIDGSKPIIAYCRIGERSSHTWFVLKYLLGFDNVTNYDGSWTEWGNLVGANVERGPHAQTRQMNTSAQEFQERRLSLAGWPVNLSSYRLDDEWHCEADNVSPGASLASTTGATRQEAEDKALARAEALLARTRRRTI
jgi:thiosulfate/3-mercaptopyruvate sulfurtransferase